MSDLQYKIKVIEVDHDGSTALNFIPKSTDMHDYQL